MQAVAALDRNKPWTLAGAIAAVGAAILMLGLLLGPTPDTDSAQALRDIDGFRTMYAVTNMIDFIGAFVMIVGLIAIARLQARVPGASLLGVLGGAGAAAGGTLILLVVVVESTVHVDLATRFVAASGAEQTAHLATADAMFVLDDAMFGVGLALMMLSIASTGGSLLQGDGPAANRMLLWVGVIVAGVASPAAIAYLFEATRPFGQLEPFLGLAVLVWLVVVGVLLWRGETAKAKAAG